MHNIGKISLSSRLSCAKDYDQYLTDLYRNSTLKVTREILEEAIDPQIIHIIDDSFLLLECWSNNTPVSFKPAPATEIVALSYLMSNTLTQELNVSRFYHPKLLSFLRQKYQTCEMDNSILLTLERHFDKIIEKTQNSCSSIYNIYQQMMDEEHSLNMILLHYNNKY